GDIDLAAFLAGNDVLLISEDVPKAITKIMEAYQAGEVTEERLAHSVKKILQAKYKVGLNQYKPIETKHLIEDLNRIKDETLSEILDRKSTRLNSSHVKISYAVFCLKKKNVSN